jgi:mannose-6-phosphate isomerase-like protein (cupin superfamily)
MLTRPRIVEKSWGRELWVHNSPMYCGKVLEVQPGKECSLHYHAQKHETFYVLEGIVLLWLGQYVQEPYWEETPGGMVCCPPKVRGEWHLVEKGSVVEIQPYMVHRFRNPACKQLCGCGKCSKPARIMEVSTQHLEDDSFRLEEVTYENG